ncbi:MAG: AAA family ATPase [Candidatus Pacebacteria bacterium]|nr:AAA family ATPase [Candidatus Paceibacterota bacterium]
MESNVENLESPIKSIWENLDEWGTRLNDWQKYILYYAIHERKLTDKRIDEAYQCFLKQAAIGGDDFDSTTVPSSFGLRNENEASKNTKLNALKNLKNINALPDIPEIKFSNQLTLIYGLNGSGKSSIARLLLSTCFSRVPVDVLSNVYSEEKKVPECDIEVELNGIKTTYKFIPENTKIAELQNIRVFDQNESRVILTKENALGFLPAGFDVFDEMIRVYKIIDNKLTQEISARKPIKSFIDVFQGESEIKTSLLNLTHNSNIEDFRVKIIDIESINAELNSDKQKLIKLQEQSPEMLVQSYKFCIKILGETVDSLKIKYKTLNTNSCTSYKELLNKLKEKLRAKDSEKFPSQDDSVTSPVRMDSEEWVDFIKSSQKFAKLENPSYPQITDDCILCHQPLTIPSVSLIKRFWGFVNSEVRTEVEKLNAEIDKILLEVKETNFDIFGQDSNKKMTLDKYCSIASVYIDTLVAELNTRRNILVLYLSGTNNVNFPENEFDFHDTEKSLIISEIEKSIEALNLNGVNLEIEKLSRNIKKNEHLILLNNFITQVDDYISSLQWLNRANTALSELITTSISKKAKDLYKKTITDVYKSCLDNESKILDFRLPYELKDRVKEGRSTRIFTIKDNFKPEQIFSEGEQRVLAFADFLTETNISNNVSSIILDDPVVSYDHLRKMKIAERILTEASKRQVIVFTHDIVFLYKLKKLSENMNIKISTHWLHKPEPTEIKFEKDNYPKSQTETFGYIENKLNHLIKHKSEYTDNNEFIQQLRHCADMLRGFIENFVITTLFNGVINRWDEVIKMTKLPNVILNEDLYIDVNKLYNDLCRVINSHDHSDDYEPILPSIETIQVLVDRTKELIQNASEFKNAK